MQDLKKEQDFIFDKSYECPVCYKSFKEKTVKTGKLKLLGTDMDLRQHYDQMEPLKYDVVHCPHCGYTAMTKQFPTIASYQRKLLKEGLKHSGAEKEECEVYTDEQAIARYRMCLASTIIKKGKNSEKAYICLKAGWLLRSMQENLDPETPDYEKKKEDLRVQEMGFLKNALEDFIVARQSEQYPICGMDEMTLEYLIAALAVKFSQDDVASKLLSNILASPIASRRIKDKARELKDLLLENRKEK